MKRKHLVSAAAVLAIGVAAWECGGGACQSTCGNGVKECSEQCDNGPANGAGNLCSTSCTIQSIPTTMLTVTYDRLHVDVASYPSFPAPTPLDLGIVNAHIVLTGPTPKDDMLKASDGNQIVYSGSGSSALAAGTYQATITLLDATNNPLTKPKTSMMADVAVNMPASLMVSFTTADYLKSYTGNFDFALHWGSLTGTCPGAKQSIKMTLPGSMTPVAMMTTDTPPEALDGTKVNCFMPTMSMKYQEVKMMPWGHYDMYVTDGTAMPAFCSKFDVFVGVGVATPTYDLVVEPASTDGGVCP